MVRFPLPPAGMLLIRLIGGVLTGVVFTTRSRQNVLLIGAATRAWFRRDGVRLL